MKYIDHKHVLDVIAQFRAKRLTLNGCHDRFCYVTGPRRGQVTNGGCRCTETAEGQYNIRKTMHWLQEMLADLEQL